MPLMYLFIFQPPLPKKRKEYKMNSPISRGNIAGVCTSDIVVFLFFLSRQFFTIKCFRLFDILNSRSTGQLGNKAPLRASNEKNWKPFLTETRQMLLDLMVKKITETISDNMVLYYRQFFWGLSVNSNIGLLHGSI